MNDSSPIVSTNGLFLVCLSEGYFGKSRALQPSKAWKSGKQSTTIAVHSDIPCWPGDEVKALLLDVMLYFRHCSSAQASKGFSFVFSSLSPCRHV